MVAIGCDGFEIGSSSIKMWRNYSDPSNKSILKDIFELDKWETALKDNFVYSPYVNRFRDINNYYLNNALEKNDKKNIYPCWVWMSNTKAKDVIAFFEGKKAEREDKEKQIKIENMKKNPQMQQLDVFNYKNQTS